MNFLNKTFILSLSVTAVTGLSAGLLWQRLSANALVATHEVEIIPGLEEASSNAPIIQGQVQKNSGAGRSIASIPTTTLPERLLKNPRLKQFVVGNKLEEHYRNLALHFPEGKMGDSLLDFTTLLEWQEMVGSAEAKFVDEKFQYIKDHPAEALEMMGLVFDKLPDTFSNERQQLMQYASKLKAEDDDKITFVMKEMKRPLGRNVEGKPEKLALFNSQAALRSLANIVGDNPSKIEPHLREALESHKGDKEVQKILIHNFAKFDPAGADKLHHEYNTK